MKFSIITPNYNGERFLERTLQSIIRQREDGIDLELIVVDGMSSDGSLRILEKYREEITHLVIEKDSGPANAINKGLTLASGNVVAWLNADDLYYPGALARVLEVFTQHKDAALCFGRCPIIDENGVEIRKFITLFKEWFFTFSCEFTYQCINYISQPALFFHRDALSNAGPLREDMVAAWDYEFILRLWSFGKGIVIPGEPIAAFRWHEQSISGQNYKIQFQEELAAVIAKLGKWKMQVLLHHCARCGIVGAYDGMTLSRNLKNRFRGNESRR